MPSKTEKQRKYVYYLRGKYKTKKDTPEKYKWVWNDEWLKVEESYKDDKYWLTDTGELVVVPKGKYHHNVVNDYYGCLSNGWIRILVANEMVHCDCYNFDNHKFKKIYCFVNKHPEYKKLPVLVNDDKTKDMKVYGSGMKENILIKYNPLKFITEKKEVLEIPNIPNTFNFWHGGNLDDYKDIIVQKRSRYEYGAGLYLTTHYDTAVKYSKGNRKLYLVTVKKGIDIHNTFISISEAIDFINMYILDKKKKGIISRLQKWERNGKINAYLFNSIILNEEAIKSTNTIYLRNFLLKQGIDYEIVHNPFGWGEEMMVLYNMKLIVKITQVTSKMEISNYDLKK